ncbi:hypothetical protein PMIN01_00013 [Paraphaeosphaeria minitans]|uniref:Uncharacterized protein n=1 Tax=Paraphaeosphaeria minitans TaxID=565426 RepID=A0A9P6GS02_9PLEO|nr:hypothetical protein PMIN01_00013 [Paraphaeosphaeria minitans]
MREASTYCSPLPSRLPPTPSPKANSPPLQAPRPTTRPRASLLPSRAVEAPRSPRSCTQRQKRPDVYAARMLYLRWGAGVSLARASFHHRPRRRTDGQTSVQPAPAIPRCLSVRVDDGRMGGIPTPLESAGEGGPVPTHAPHMPADTYGKRPAVSAPSIKQQREPTDRPIQRPRGTTTISKLSRCDLPQHLLPPPLPFPPPAVGSRRWAVHLTADGRAPTPYPLNTACPRTTSLTPRDNGLDICTGRGEPSMQRNQRLCAAADAGV